MVDLETVGNDVPVLALRFGRAGHLPSEWKLDGDIINLLAGVLKVNSMNSIGMVEQVFLGRAEEAKGKQSSSSCTRGPTGDLQIKFGDERWLRSTPVWVVSRLHCDGGGNIFAHQVFYIFIALGLLLVKF